MPTTNQPSPLNQTSLQQGFTLLEILVVITILIISTQVLLPAGQNMLAKSRVTAASNQIQAGLIYARTEAKRLKKTAKLCGFASINDTACSNTTAPVALAVFANNLLTKIYELDEEIVINWQGVSSKEIVFEAQGNRPPADNPVVIQLAKDSQIKEVEVCFNGRLFTRKQQGISEC